MTWNSKDISKSLDIFNIMKNYCLILFFSCFNLSFSQQIVDFSPTRVIGGKGDTSTNDCSISQNQSCGLCLEEHPCWATYHSPNTRKKVAFQRLIESNVQIHSNWRRPRISIQGQETTI